MKCQWKLTITKRQSDSIIGIASMPNINDTYWNINYGYQTSGGDKWKLGKWSDYGIPTGSGQALIINVDFKRKEIGFVVNGKDQGVAFKDVEIGPVYYLVVGFHFEGECVNLNDFKCGNSVF